MSRNNASKSSAKSTDRPRDGESLSAAEGRDTRLAYSLLRAVGKLVPRFLFRIKILYILWLPRELWRPPVDRSGCRWATTEDVGLLENLGQQSQVVHKRLSEGDRAVIREKDGLAIGWMWLTQSNPIYDGWLQIQLSNSDMWIFDVFVSPDHRGEGIANQIGNFARSELASQGIEKVAAITNALNYSASRASEKTQYRAARFWYVRLLGLSLVRLPRGWRFGWWGLGRSLRVPLSELTVTTPT